MKSRKISLILILTIIFFTLSSCRDTLPPDYRKTAFFAEIRYEYGDEIFCAEINVEAPSGSQNMRDIEMTFTSPKNLEGICVSKKDGVTSVIFSSAEVNSEAAANRFLKIAKILIHSGNMNFIERSEKNGLVFYSAKISDEYNSITVLLDKNGIPISLAFDDINITVIRFEQR